MPSPSPSFYDDEGPVSVVQAGLEALVALVAVSLTLTVFITAIVILSKRQATVLVTTTLAMLAFAALVIGALTRSDAIITIGAGAVGALGAALTSIYQRDRLPEHAEEKKEEGEGPTEKGPEPSE